MDLHTSIWCICCPQCKMLVPVRNWQQPAVCRECQTPLPLPKSCAYLHVYCLCCQHWHMVAREWIAEFTCPCQMRTAADCLHWALGCPKCQLPVAVHGWDQPVLCPWCHMQMAPPRVCESVYVYCDRCRQWNNVPQNQVLQFCCACHTQPEKNIVATSDLLLARYRLIEVIGKGLCGQVWKAIDIKSSPPALIAIKFIQEDNGPEGQIIRAKREAEALSRVCHPGIMHIYACLQNTGAPIEEDGKHAGFDFSRNTACIVMKYVDGGNLATWIQERNVTLGMLARIFMPIYEALEAIHQSGIVHRDLKPSNILMDGERPIITDFGLSRIVDATTITQQGTIMGTLDYLSPEQARAKKADARSDLYATGAMMWKILFKKPVFEGSGPLIQLRRISCDPIPQDIEILPPAFQYILRRLLAKNAQLRFQSAAEVQQLLGEFLQHGNMEADFAPFTGKVEPSRYKGMKLLPPQSTAPNPELSKTQEKPRNLPRRPTRRSRRYAEDGETSTWLLHFKSHVATHFTIWLTGLSLALLSLLGLCLYLLLR